MNRTREHPDQIESKNILIIFLLGILAILQGYHFGSGDLATYIPFVYHKHNPQLFQNDLLIETLGSHPVYIWDFFALFLNFVDIKSIFKLFFLIQIFSIIICLRLVYKEISGSNDGWILLLLLLVISKKSPAMGLYGINAYNYFHPGALAVAFTFAAYLLMLRKNWIWAGIVTGSIFLFHPFSAIYASLFFFVKLLLDIREIPREKIIFSIAALLLISSPGWFPHLLGVLQHSGDTFDKELWLKIVEMRMNRSFFFSMWITDRYFHIAFIFFGLWVFRKTPQFKLLLPIVLGTSAALCLKIFAELFESKFLLQLQLARGSYYLHMTFFFLLANRMKQVKIESRDLINLGWIFLGMFLMLYPIIEHDRTAFKWILTGLILASLIALYFRSTKQKHIVILFFILLIVATGYKTTRNIIENNRIYDTTGSSQWEDMQLWCREHVPVDETILTPIYREGFRSLSQRSIYGSYKDGAPHNY
jgi:hypothetical protein